MRISIVLLILLITSGCANKDKYARDYFGASRGPVGLDVCMDFSGRIADRNYLPVKEGVILERYMEKRAVVELLGQPDDVGLNVTQQEQWLYKKDKLRLFFDKDMLTRWERE